MFAYEDKLTPGSTFKLLHSISFREQYADLAPLVSKTIGELEKLKTESSGKEQEIFDKLRKAVTEWEQQAAQTLLLDKALEYVKTPTVKHTNNQWQKGEYGYYEISNMVYKMSYRIREDTSYDRTLKKSVPVAWYVSWTVSVNEPQRKGYYRTSASIIAGQEQKRYTDKAAAEKYVQGRFDAYSHLFTELSPPIPEDKKQFFTVNGHLLPGYSVQPHEPTAQELLDFLDDKDFSSAVAAPAPAEKAPDKKPAKTGKAPAKKRNNAPSR